MDFRADFDLDPNVIYLNSGTHSLCPRSTLEAVTRYQRAFERNPTDELLKAWGKLWKIQCELSSFFNAKPTDIFLRPSITEVLNAIVLGLTIPRGSELLMSDLEYGAIQNLCRFRCERDGLKLRKFALPSRPEDLARQTKDSLLESVVKAINTETRVLLLSHIVTGNGLILPIREIAQETRRRGILLIIDGAHAPGALELDFNDLQNVDFYGGNLHKWMMGPKGTAFGWVPERNHALLSPTHAGWTTYGDDKEYFEHGGGSQFQKLILRASCQNFSPYFGIHETLQYWNSKGANQIRARIYELQKFVEAEVKERLGWCLASPLAGDLRGPLVSFELPEHLAKEGVAFMMRLFRETGLQISTPIIQGKARLRFSPHIYNTEDEIRRAVEILLRKALTT